jgi:2-polyprenyl-3-methyl-5-hydroxy-6-metoxy-1,4-benzoquinol methylase
MTSNTSDLTAKDVNAAFYGAVHDGQLDYWTKMAAPRFRAQVFVDTVRGLGVPSVVDLGCGNGALLQKLKAGVPGLKLCGIDLSANQIAQNRAAAADIAWHQKDLGDPQGSALKETYALATACEVVEHIERPEVFLENARRLVDPKGGMLFLSTQSGPIRETERRVGHHKHYSQEEIKALLQRGGWTPVRVWNSGYPFHDLSKWYANRDPDATMQRFGYQKYGLYEEAVCAALRFLFRFNSSRRGAQLFALARAAR